MPFLAQRRTPPSGNIRLCLNTAFRKVTGPYRILFFLPGDEGLQFPDVVLHDLIVVDIEPFTVLLQGLAVLLPVLELPGLLPLADQSTWGMLVFMGRVSFRIMMMTCCVLLILALLDYLYQRWEFEKSIRMSRQEIKEEFKHTEGDPLVKSRIKRLQRDIARKRMMAGIPKADVVITNPTHLAVAIRYDQDNMNAPVVVAKGAGYLAKKIRMVAAENQIPIVENKPVARVLYKIANIGDTIPADLYRAVAEILAYVYRLKEKSAMA